MCVQDLSALASCVDWLIVVSSPSFSEDHDDYQVAAVIIVPQPRRTIYICIDCIQSFKDLCLMFAYQNDAMSCLPDPKFCPRAGA